MIDQDEIEFKTKIIDKELKKHLTILNKEKPSSEVFNAIENVTKMLILNRKLQNNEIPKNDIVKSLEYLVDYVKQIN